MQNQDPLNTLQTELLAGMAWCLAWGTQRQPQIELEVLKCMRQALLAGQPVPKEVRSRVESIQQLQELPFPETVDELAKLPEQYPQLWQSQIGLVYGGATKIKQYVFEAAKLPDIRGASALLDRINLIDIPAFFREGGQRSLTVENWLKQHFPVLAEALIPELLIYYKGGNILAFCPAALVDDLANAIEKRYTEETLTANSCAVGTTFKPLEIRFGLLQDPIQNTFWLDQYLTPEAQSNELVKTYFDQADITDPVEKFKSRKNFNELAGKLAALFNQRRNGNDFVGSGTNSAQESQRPSRRYPPMFETHPYLIRDEGDRRSAITQAQALPGAPYFSETLARKHLIGQIAKRDSSQSWYDQTGLAWHPREITVPSWVRRFEEYLQREGNSQISSDYYNNQQQIQEARTLREIGNVSQPSGFVGYIYADGNNMGGYIQKNLTTPEEYKKFSNDIFQATSESVYYALAKHLQPRRLSGMSDPDAVGRNSQWIHPFEIITIGGDDVMLIVPADQALAIAHTIGERFEELLNQHQEYRIQDPSLARKSVDCHRYKGDITKPADCQLSMSTGVLVTAEDTPIYYAQKLTEQLLKSAKQYAKQLKKDKTYRYHGGTVDFFVMKSVTMLSSNISEFRKEALTKSSLGKPKLKLYAAPYTLHELQGLLKTAQVLKKADFPRSQLYQIRSLLEQGKRTAILNYLYFRTRLSNKQAQHELIEQFEKAWCNAKTNNGNLAPWMFEIGSKDKGEDSSTNQRSTYETIWRELVDLYPFTHEPSSEPMMTLSQSQGTL